MMVTCKQNLIPKSEAAYLPVIDSPEVDILLIEMLQERPCMRRIVQCGVDDPNMPELWDGESIDYSLDDVEISFSADKGSEGIGKLFITSRRVIWLGRDEKAFDFDVPYIVLHAITRDVDSYPKPCIYCQLDCEECLESDDGDDSEDALADEMFLVPNSDEHLSAMFNALSAAALNNPDPPEEWEQEGDDELIYNLDEVELGAEQARTLEHLESVFNVPMSVVSGEEEETEEDPGQFNDK